MLGILEVALYIMIGLNILAMFYSTTGGFEKPWRKVPFDITSSLMILLCAGVQYGRGEMTWCIICTVLFFLNIPALVYHIRYAKRKDEERKKREQESDRRISLASTRRVLNEFIKDIEIYGSKRH